MANRMKDVSDLVKRCEAVGWDVKTVGDGARQYRVFPPGRESFTLNPGVRAKHGLTHILRKAGLFDAEQALKLQQERDRLQRIADDRAKISLLHEQPPCPDPNDRRAEINQEETTMATVTTEQEAPVPAGLEKLVTSPVQTWAFARTPLNVVDKNGVEMLLEDSSVVYGCIRGDFVGPHWQALSKHRAAEHPELTVRGRKRIADAAIAAEAGTQAPTQKPAKAPAVKPDTTAKKSVPPAAPALFQSPAAEDTKPAPRRRLTAVSDPVPATNGSAVEDIADALPQRVAKPVDLAAPPPPVSAAPGTLSLPEMLARMREFQQLQEKQNMMRRELEETKASNRRMRDDLDKVRRHNAALVEESVTKNKEVAELRATIESMKADVAAAAELQKVLSGMFNTGPATAVA